MNLELHLVGNSYIELNGKKLRFSLRKAEAVIFYTAICGPVTRERLKTVFWKDKDAAQASANLRNTIYVIRNAIKNHLKCSRKEIEVIDFSFDIDKYSKIRDPLMPIPENISEEILKGIDVTNSDDFDEWAASTKESLKNRLLLWIRERIAACYDSRDMENLALSLETLLGMEPYDENSVLELMDVYNTTEQRAKAIVLYKNYAAKIENELGIAPSERAKGYFQRFICTEPEKAAYTETTGKFWCRSSELTFMLDAVKNDPEYNKAFFLYGEAGIGKTAIINQVISIINSSDNIILTSKTFTLGGGYSYSSWNNIMMQIGTVLEENNIFVPGNTQSILSGVFPGFLRNKRLNYNADVALITERNPLLISGMICSLLKKISERKKIIIVFEDIHWFDSQSLRLLTSVVEEIDAQLNIIMSGRPETSKITLNMLRNIKPLKKWQVVPLQLTSLRREEIVSICKYSLPHETISVKGEEYFIRESEGIPLLLFEMLRAINENPESDCTKGLGALIMGRIGDLSQLQRDILAVISVFAIGAEPANIAEVLCKDTAEITPPAEELISRCLIREGIECGRVTWQIIHERVRSCVYESVSLAKREVLHAKVAEVLSRNYSAMSWNPKLSTMLCHHYVKSGQRVKELRQYISELIFEITINHDIFPIVPDLVLLSCSSPFSTREDSEIKIKRALEILEEISLRKGIGQREYAQLEASCFELAGSYYMSWGEYEIGKVYISRAIRLSQEYNFIDTNIHCLKHTAYMYIQTDNSQKLLSAARELIKLAKEADAAQYLATAVRFVGISCFIEGNYDRALKIFHHTVKQFETLKITGKRYTLGALVAKCYIAEIHQLRGEYDQSLTYLTDCIETAEKMGLYWGRSYFHTHAANLAFYMGDWDLFFHHVDTGVCLFESCQGGRCGSMLYSLKAIAEAQRGNTSNAIAALNKGEIFLKSIARKEWLAAQYLAKAWVLSRMSKSEAEEYQGSEIMTNSAAEWSRKAAELYKNRSSLSKNINY